MSQPFFQGHGFCEQLEGGTGFKGITDHGIPPHIIPVCYFFFIRQAFHIGGLFRIQRNPGVVGVVFRIDGHGQNFTGGRFHDDGITPFGLGLHHGIFQRFFRIMLDDLIDGQLQTEAILRFIVFFQTIGKAVSADIHVLNPSSGGPSQNQVVPLLDADDSPVVISDIAQYVGGKGSQRIIPLHVLLQVHSCNSRLLQHIRLFLG